MNDGHIVPRMYQVAWEDEDRKVAVHRVGGGGCKMRSTKRVATRGPFYRRTRPEGETSDDVEDSLRRIEDKASDPLRNLIAGGSLDEETKGIVAQLFAAQMFRGPAFFSQREELIRPPLEAASSDAFTRHGLAAAGGDVEVVREKAIDAYLDPTQRFITMLSYAVKVASVLGLMRWHVLRFDEPLLAYSDHPVVLWPLNAQSSEPFPRQGLGPLETLEIRVPIAPNVAILMNWLNLDDQVDVQMAASTAAELNAFTISQAEKEWMHQPGREPEIAQGVFKPLSRLIDASYGKQTVLDSARHRRAKQFVAWAQERKFVNEVQVQVKIGTASAQAVA